MPRRPSKAEDVASVTGGAQMRKSSLPPGPKGDPVVPSGITEFQGVHADPRLHHSRSQGEPEQLGMFMTPREIHERWQPLDADRKDVEDYDGGTWEGTRSPKSWDTGNTQPEGSDINFVSSNTYDRVQRRYPGVHSGPGRGPYGDTGTIRRTRGGGKVRLYDRGSGESVPESDDELWDRKLEEASTWGRTGQHGEYGLPDPANAHGDQPRRPPPPSITDIGAMVDRLRAEGHGDNTVDSAVNGLLDRPGAPRFNGFTANIAAQQARHDSHNSETLYDSIEREGVKAPIHLGREIGSMGLPQIVGGHHRMAAATEADPDRLVPVMHHETIEGAQRMSDYS
jgi:hypothetical protein